MLYQYISWHMGFGRRLCVVQVERLFARLRDANGGRLPLYLRNFEQRVIFAGESAITLPENKNVAESIVVGDAYPTMDWLNDKYAEVLAHVKLTNETLLLDPPAAKFIETAVEITPADLESGKVTLEGLFDQKIEGSVSNTEGRDTCSDRPPVNSPLGSTSTASPNSALTTPQEQPSKPSPQPPPNSTRTRTRHG